jgi:plastocyanin
MRLGALTGAVVLTLALLPRAASHFAAAAAPQVHNVIIEGMRFQPQGLTVAPGDTIVWINRDMVPHTATAADKGFDSSEIAAGKSWTYTVQAKGEISYSCTYHPLMKGSVRVKPSKG